MFAAPPGGSALTRCDADASRGTESCIVTGMGAEDGFERLRSLMRELDDRCKSARAVRQELAESRSRRAIWPDRRRVERKFESIPPPDALPDSDDAVR